MLTSLVEQIKRLRNESQIEHEFSIFWVPRRTLVSDQLLEGAGVLGEASIDEWPMFFVPLADDVMSLELEDAVSDLYLVCLSSMILILNSPTAAPRSYLDISCSQSADAAAAEVRPLSTYHW